MFSWQQIFNYINTGVQYVYKFGKQNTNTVIEVGTAIIKPYFDQHLAFITNFTNMGCTASQAGRVAGHAARHATGTKRIVKPVGTQNITTSATLPASQARKPITRKLRNNVWTKYHNNHDHGSCYCCGIRVERYNSGWHCSHVIANAYNGELTVDNLRCCCSHCNLSMGTQNLYVYIKAKNLQGPGAKNVTKYFQDHPEYAEQLKLISAASNNPSVAVRKRPIITKLT